MSNARIIEIPATRQIRSGKNNTMRKMRVAAYCRVSTEEEEQQGSFETQKLYYTEKINSTSEWELAGIYADDGISGIHTKKRDGFNQMIPKRLTLYRAIHSYTNARTGKSKTLADAGITFWESELLHDGYRITDQTGTRASRPYTTKIG